MNKLTLQQVISLPDAYCEFCGAPFIEDYAVSHRKKYNRKRFCSKKCWARGNKGKQKEQNKKWHLKHPNYIKNYFRKNRKRLYSYHRDYYRKNRIRLLEYAGNFYGKNKKRICARERAQYARKKKGMVEK